MSSSPYKRNPSDGVKGLLSARKSVYKQGPHHDAAVRNPAFVSIVSSKGGAVPAKDITFEDTYINKKFKPAPILQEVVLRHGGNFGLVLELQATIQCHTLGDFKYIEDKFMSPGTNLSVVFGYPKPFGKGYQKGRRIVGFKVATYSFNTTSEGFWIAKFTAAAPAIAINKLQSKIQLEPKGRKYKGKRKKYDVTGLAQLLAYDAQKNGTVDIDKINDGEVITVGSHGHVVVYEPDHLYKNGFTQWFGTIGKTNQVDKTDNVVYVTLEYIVNRFFNSEVFPKYKQDTITDPDFDKCKIKFDSQLSYSYTHAHMRSAYPTKILFLGGGLGDYENRAGTGGKNFEELKGASGGVMAATPPLAGIRAINLRKILVQRDVILAALDDIFEEQNAATTNEIKETEEGTTTIERFFKIIFDEISKASGGAMKLRLAQHPDIHKGTNEQLPYELYIFDENNGNYSGGLPCIVFDPIRGDGSTRVCTLTSNVGSSEYQGYLFSGAMRKADPMYEAQGLLNPSKRASAASNAITRINHIIYGTGADGGSLGDNQFDNIDMQALEQCMQTLRIGDEKSKQKDMLIYVGLGIDLEIDGVFGILPGNAIYTTQMPPKYKSANSYFFVESVEHVFQGDVSDWSTKIQGKLSFHTKVDYQYI